jgi:hypothetical protein
MALFLKVGDFNSCFQEAWYNLIIGGSIFCFWLAVNATFVSLFGYFYNILLKGISDISSAANDFVNNNSNLFKYILYFIQIFLAFWITKWGSNSTDKFDAKSIVDRISK